MLMILDKKISDLICIFVFGCSILKVMKLASANGSSSQVIILVIVLTAG